MTKMQDELHDKQRMAVTAQVNLNHHNFCQQNRDVARNTQEINQVMEAERKQREAEWKQNDQARDKAELAYTNASQLLYSQREPAAEKLE